MYTNSETMASCIKLFATFRCF